MWTFKIADIVDEEGFNFNETVPEAELAALFAKTLPAEEAQLNGPLAVQFDISIGAKELLLLGSMGGTLAITCSRCLCSFKYPFKQELEETYARDLITIDVSNQLLEALLLAVPQKPLCRNDCKGLCQVCGNNLNEKICGCEIPKPTPFAKLKDINK